MVLSKLIETLRLFCLFMVTVFVSRYFPLGDKSAAMNAFLLLFFLLSYPALRQIAIDKLAILMMAALALLACYSFYLGNSPASVFRFFAILLLTVLAYFAAFNSWRAFNALLGLYVLHALVLIALGIGMAIVFGNGDYSIVRNFFGAAGYGDIYTFGSGFFRVQLRGNALLPFFLMLTVYLAWLSGSRRYRYLAALLFAGVIFAGNFAYYIAITVFLVLFLLINTNTVTAVRRYILLLLAGGIFMATLGWRLVMSVLDTKLGGEHSSLGVRHDQIAVLLSNLDQNYISLLFGQGLGNMLKVQTFVRDYTDAVYYEVQVVYILNQLGIIPFVLLVFGYIVLSFKVFQDRVLLLIFACYVLYASTNPYIFDTNHVIVIVVLASLGKMLPKRFDIKFPKHTKG